MSFPQLRDSLHGSRHLVWCRAMAALAECAPDAGDRGQQSGIRNPKLLRMLAGWASGSSE